MTVTAHDSKEPRTEPIRKVLFVHIIVLVVLFLTSFSARAQVALQINEGESVGTATAGYFGLRWGDEAQEGGTWRLERDDTPAFTDPLIVYEGPDHGTFESGLPDGAYHYRLIRNGQTGPVYRVEVRHHSLERAFLFLGTGAIVFLVLSFVLVRADRSQDPLAPRATASRGIEEGS